MKGATKQNIFIARRNLIWILKFKSNAIFVLREKFVIYTWTVDGGENLIDFNVFFKSFTKPYILVRGEKGSWLLNDVIQVDFSKCRRKTIKIFITTNDCDQQMFLNCFLATCIKLTLSTFLKTTRLETFLPNFPVHYCFSMLFILCRSRSRNISDAYVMMLFKQYWTKPWFLLVNHTQFSSLNRRRKRSTSRFIISTSNATLGWLNSRGCCRRRGKIVYSVSFDARKVVACWSARLSENQRCVVNRSDDTKSARLECHSDWVV